MAGTDIVDGLCHAGESCAHRDTNFGSNIADFDTCEPDWFCGVANFSVWDYNGTSTSPDDRTSSYWNRVTTYTHTVYAQHDFGGGPTHCFTSGSMASSLSFIGGNDIYSSIFNANYCP